METPTSSHVRRVRADRAEFGQCALLRLPGEGRHGLSEGGDVWVGRCLAVYPIEERGQAAKVGCPQLPDRPSINTAASAVVARSSRLVSCPTVVAFVVYQSVHPIAAGTSA